MLLLLKVGGMVLVLALVIRGMVRRWREVFRPKGADNDRPDEDSSGKPSGG
jgi:hypothetical protein